MALDPMGRCANLMHQCAVCTTADFSSSSEIGVFSGIWEETVSFE